MNRAKILFATPELEPMVPGGAGALVAGLLRLLRQLPDSDASVLLAAPEVERAQAADHVVTIDLRAPDGTVEWYLERSRALAESVSLAAARRDAPLAIEFTDFEAPAWYALLNRSQLGLENTQIGVRIHGPVEAITDAIGARPAPLDTLSEMESLVFEMADFVIAPSTSMGAWAKERYGIDGDRVVVGPPPVLQVARRSWTPTESPHFVFFGRLAEAKGVQDLVAAAVGVLNSIPTATLSLIGPDGWSLVEDRPMSEALRSRIPDNLQERIRFEGRLPREKALDRLMNAWAVVLPSRFESFCLAAHEARRAGAPVVVPDLPAFDDFEESTGSLKYDGSIDRLADVLDAIAGDRGLVEPLAGREAPPVGDPVAVYQQELPPPRHVSEQNGLATSASIRLTELLEEQEKHTRIGKRVLRLAPNNLVGALSRLTPGILKRRLRSSWWKEQARRAAEARAREVRSLIDKGVFPRYPSPRTSVVIPCFDQGEWVERAVLSVFEQSQHSWEIILVDDGSSDSETVRVLDELATWSRVELIRQENKGLPATRNVGMSAARGEFLVPLDADDELHPAYLSSMSAALDANPNAGYAHCNGRYIGDMDAYWITRPFNPYQLLLSNSVLGCALIRRSAWEAVDGYDETMTDGHEDWDFWIKLLDAGWGQVKVSDPLFHYRMHGHSMSVDALSHYESARMEIIRRHPELYATTSLRKRKADWYPWVTVLYADPERMRTQTLGDVETMTVDDDESSVVDAILGSRGKIVVESDLLMGEKGDELVRIAEALESRPDADKVVSGGIPVAWRRWALHDPQADPGISIKLELPLRPGAEPRLFRGMCPIREWMVPEALPEPDLDVIRQRPEEEGPLPKWAL